MGNGEMERERERRSKPITPTDYDQISIRHCRLVIKDAQLSGHRHLVIDAVITHEFGDDELT